MAIETRPWDAAELLIDDETIAAYLDEAFASGDVGLIASAIGAVARARNVAAIARESDLSRETIYSAFSGDGNPRLATVLAVVKALGFNISVKPTG